MRGTLIAAAMMSVLAGCSTYDSVTQRFAQHITPYRITIVQGNFVSQEAASQMKVGMTRDQVKAVLGTPLLADMFHADRWDYIFYFKRGSTAVVQQRDFQVTFNGDVVSGWKGGEDLPSNLELLAEIDGDKGRKLPSAALAAAPASGASGAAGAAAATGASGVAPVETVSTPAGQAATPTASNAMAGDPNQQAAQAANRATDAVQAPTGRTRSSAFSSAPTTGNLPATIGGSGNSQIQLQRRPDPATLQGSGNPQGPTSPTVTPGQATFYVPGPNLTNQ